jgi:hypothetical protein
MQCGIFYPGILGGFIWIWIMHCQLVYRSCTLFCILTPDPDRLAKSSDVADDYSAILGYHSAILGYHSAILFSYSASIGYSYVF